MESRDRWHERGHFPNAEPHVLRLWSVLTACRVPLVCLPPYRSLRRCYTELDVS